MSKNDLIGMRFGKLTVLEKLPSVKVPIYRCKCDCGGERSAVDKFLLADIILSCGCLSPTSLEYAGMKFELEIKRIEMNERKKSYYMQNKEKILAKCKKYYEENKAMVLEKARKKRIETMKNLEKK